MISVQHKRLQSAHQTLYAAVESRNQCTIMSFKYNATLEQQELQTCLDPSNTRSLFNVYQHFSIS